MLKQRLIEIVPEQEQVVPSSPQVEPEHSRLPAHPDRALQEAGQAPLTLRRDGARALQRAMGNRAVWRWQVCR